MPRVHLNIGSNLGDKTTNISRAIASLKQSPGLFTPEPELRVSREYESEPWGYESANGFVNVGLSFETEMSPMEVLGAVAAVQRGINPSPHRDAMGGYVDRVIDIDIIFYGDMVMESEELTLPHPRMELRDFVLVPLSETDGTWRHPLTGMTAGEMLEKNEKKNKIGN